jgi:hypothetical protein
MSMTTKRLSSTVLLLLMCSCVSNAFYINLPAFAARGRIHNGGQSSLLELSMIEDSLVQSFDFKMLELLQEDALSTARSHSLMTPDVEAEVLTDMAHVMMDFSGFLITPSKSMLRCLSVVVGRILVLSADYLPDHTVHPEELFVQLFLLAVSLRDVVKALELHIQHDTTRN